MFKDSKPYYVNVCDVPEHIEFRFCDKGHHNGSFYSDKQPEIHPSDFQDYLEME